MYLMSQAWMVASGKGGVGKSTLAAALAVGLAMRGQSVAVVDTDIGLRSLDVMLGLENHIVFDLVDVIRGACKLKQALIPHWRYPTLSLLPAAQMSDSTQMTALDMQRIILRLKKNFAYVLVDCPAGIGRGFENILGAADDTILVTTPDDVAMRDVERVCGLITDFGLPRPMLIINQVIGDMIRSGEMYTPETIAQTLDLQLLGVVPKSDQVYRHLLHHMTAIEGKGDVQSALNRIVRRLIGEQIPVPEIKKSSRTAIMHLFRREKKGSEWL
jgi:septum site-determining protein MinD